MKRPPALVNITAPIDRHRALIVKNINEMGHKRRLPDPRTASEDHDLARPFKRPRPSLFHHLNFLHAIKGRVLDAGKTPCAAPACDAPLSRHARTGAGKPFKS